MSSVTPGKEQIRGEVGRERREEKIQQGDSRTATTEIKTRFIVTVGVLNWTARSEGHHLCESRRLILHGGPVL